MLKKINKLCIIISIIYIFFIIFNLNGYCLEPKVLNKKEIKYYVKEQMSNYKNEIIFYYNGNDIKNWLKEDVLSYYNLGELNYYNYDGCKIYYTYYPDTTLVKLNINYKVSKKQMKYVNKHITKIAKRCKANTKIKTIKNVNNYFKRNLTYETSQNSIYIGLKNKKGNCYTYSILTYLTLNKLGIKNNTVYGTVNNGEHIWNKVKINNKWKYLDVTYNDYLNNKYFLMNKNQISKTHIEKIRN